MREPLFIREQIPVRISFIRHGTEFIKPEYLFVLPRSVLGKDSRFSQLATNQNPQNHIQWGKHHYPRERQQNIQKAFDTLFIHPINHAFLCITIMLMQIIRG